MEKKTDPADIGHAAGKNGQELGIENEEALLKCIETQGWVRECEAALLTGMSPYSVGVVSRRLFGRGEIFRDRPRGNAGHFLRLTVEGASRIGGKSGGEDISIPASWRHDCLAIQTLHFLAGVYKCQFVTESAMQGQLRNGKMPDGELVKAGEQFYFEQEWSRKSGPQLRVQVKTVVSKAIKGDTCHLSYPHPPAIMCDKGDKIDHETRLTNAIRKQLGSGDASNIKLVRCHFDTKVALYNVRPSRFEIIDLPPLFDTPAARRPEPIIAQEGKKFDWKPRGISPKNMPQRTEVTLHHNGVMRFKGVFAESIDYDEPHLLEVDGFVAAESIDENQSFYDFMLEQQARIEKEIEAETKTVIGRYEL